MEGCGSLRQFTQTMMAAHPGASLCYPALGRYDGYCAGWKGVALDMDHINLSWLFVYAVLTAAGIMSPAQEDVFAQSEMAANGSASLCRPAISRRGSLLGSVREMLDALHDGGARTGWLQTKAPRCATLQQSV